MKRVLSILIITALLLPMLTKIGIVIDFKINQDYIAEVLCINKAKPMSKCNGKCYLSKQLKQVEEQEESQAPTNKKEKLEVVFCYSKRVYDFISIQKIKSNKINPAYVDDFYSSSFIAEIFHPPKLNLM